MELLISKAVTPNIKRLEVSGKASSQLRRGGSGILFRAEGKETWRVPTRLQTLAVPRGASSPRRTVRLTRRWCNAGEPHAGGSRRNSVRQNPHAHLLPRVHGEGEPLEQVRGWMTLRCTSRTYP